MDPDEPDPPQQPPPEGRSRRELTVLETKQIISVLMEEVKDRAQMNKFRRGALTAVAKRFHVHPKTIRRVWARAMENYANPHVCTFSASPRKN